MALTIYATPFDPATKQCTAASMPSGVESFFEVMARRGVPDRVGARMLLYAGWAFTDYPLHTGPLSWTIDRPDNIRVQSGQIGG